MKIAISLKSRILLGILSFSLFFTFAMALSINKLHQKYLFNQTQQNLTITAKNFSAIQRENIAMYNLILLQQALYQTVLQNKLQQGRLTYFDGQSIHFYRNENNDVVGSNLLTQAQVPISVEITGPVYKVTNIDNKNIGTITLPVYIGKEIFAYIEFSMVSNFHDNLLESSHNMVLIVGVISMILISILSMAWVMKCLIHPIDQLMLVAKRLSNNDYSINIKIKSEDEIGKLTQTFLTMRDTIKKQFEHSSNELKSRNIQLAKAQSVARLGFWEWDASSNTIHTTHTGLEVMLLPKESPLELPLDDFCQYMESSSMNHFKTLLFEPENNTIHELTCVLNNNNKGNYHIIIQLQRDENDANRRVGTVRDISKEIQQQKKVRQLAYFDSLTHLPNRSYFTDCLRLILSDTTEKYYIAILFLDIDKFKNINDTYGHEIGDEVIRYIGQFIRSQLSTSTIALLEDYLDQPYLLKQSPAALASRYGGDEYTVLIKANNQSLIKDHIHHLEKGTRVIEIKTTSGIEIKTSLSIGVSLQHCFTKLSVEKLISRASIALHFAKLTREPTAIYFVSQMKHKMESISLREEFIKDSIEQKKLFLHYQPIISTKERSIASIETLTRFQLPQLPRQEETINIRSIIDDVERLGLMRKMDHWMLVQVCKDARLRLDKYNLSFPVSINISPIQIDTHDFTDNILYYLDTYSLPPSSLVIEVTENESLDRSQLTSRNIQRMRQAGVKVYIDDFGTGYTSLASLHRIEIDGIKIDRGLIQMLGKNAMGDWLVETAVSLAHAMDAVVVAEGIEHEQQANTLINMGVEYLQGFLFGMPMEHQKLIAMAQAEMNTNTSSILTSVNH